MAAICGRGLPFRTFDSFAMLCELLNDGQAIALSSWDAHGSDAPSLALETMLRFSGITATRQSSTSYLLYDGICFSPMAFGRCSLQRWAGRGLHSRIKGDQLDCL
jgi:hypothetical protein